MDKLEQYLAFLGSQEARIGPYHDHKENMAWSATGVACAAAFAMAGKLIGDHTALGHTPQRVVATIVVVALVLAVVTFVHMQFSMRWLASNQHEAIRRARQEVLFWENDDEVSEKLKLADRSQWTRHVQEHIVEAEKRCPRTFSEARKACWTLLKPWRWSDVDARWRTEIPSYFSLLIATAVAVTCIWGAV